MDFCLILLFDGESRGKYHVDWVDDGDDLHVDVVAAVGVGHFRCYFDVENTVDRENKG